jgi:hypothetical protein
VWLLNHPVLIEKVRTVVTGSAGRDAITNLRPGMYVVSFSLVGFRRCGARASLLLGASEAQMNTLLAVKATASGARDTVSRARAIYYGREP